jgi:acyl-CoA synthetase (AMP-forming)/AMP-acid ligase II
MVANSKCVVVDRLAALLKTRGVNPGDTIGVFTTNSPEMVITLYALSKLGAVSAMINTNLRGTLYPHVYIYIYNLKERGKKETKTKENRTNPANPTRRHIHPLPKCLRLKTNNLNS